MIKQRFMKKMWKGILSGTLVFSILCSLFVPFGPLASFADEEPAIGSQIYAFLNKIDTRSSRTEAYHLELVFKNENVKDANYYAGPYTDFAEREYVTTTYKVDSTGRPAKTWNYSQRTRISKLSYSVGETLNTAGLNLTAAYGGWAETVDSGFRCSPTALTTAGTQVITVSYGGETTAFSVTVSAGNLYSGDFI